MIELALSGALPTVEVNPMNLPPSWPVYRESLLISGLMRQRKIEVLKLRSIISSELTDAAYSIFDLPPPPLAKDWSKLSEEELRRVYEHNTGLKLDDKGNVIR